MAPRKSSGKEISFTLQNSNWEKINRKDREATQRHQQRHHHLHGTDSRCPVPSFQITPTALSQYSPTGKALARLGIPKRQVETQTKNDIFAPDNGGEDESLPWPPSGCYSAENNWALGFVRTVEVGADPFGAGYLQTDVHGGTIDREAVLVTPQ